MGRVEEMLAELREERQKLAAELDRVDHAIATLQGSARPYAMLNVYEAAVHFLTAAGEPKTTREIADALRAGGFKTRAGRFSAIVSTMLLRPSRSEYGIRRTPDRKRWFVSK